jgi:hypothetical protein
MKKDLPKMEVLAEINFEMFMKLKQILYIVKNYDPENAVVLIKSALEELDI